MVVDVNYVVEVDPGKVFHLLASFHVDLQVDLQVDLGQLGRTSNLKKDRAVLF